MFTSGIVGQVLTTLSSNPRLKFRQLQGKNPEQFQCVNPIRPGADNPTALHITAYSEDVAVYHDFPSGEGGFITQLAEQMGIEIPRRKVETTKRAYKGLEDYAIAHGLTAQELLKVGWAYEVYEGRPALVFKVGNFKRWRFLDNAPDKPTYKSQYGFKPSLYGLQNAIKIATTQSSVLIMVNGEISTIAGQCRDLPTFCLAGGERKIPDGLLTKLNELWNGTIILAFDCDATGIKTAWQIHQQLPNSLVADMGLSKGGDFADFQMLWTKDTYSELSRRAVKLTAPTPPQKPGILISSRDVVKRAHQRAIEWRNDPQERRGLPTGFVFFDRVLHGWRSNDIVGLIGLSGSGKTQTITQMASANKAKSLVLSTEMHPEDWIDRIVAARLHTTLECIYQGTYAYPDKMDQVYREVEDCFDMLFLPSCDPDPKEVWEAAHEAVIERGVKIIFIDSFNNIRAKEAGTKIYDQTRSVGDVIRKISYELKVPVIMTIQENGEGEAYGGRTTTQDCSVVVRQDRPSLRVLRDKRFTTPEQRDIELRKIIGGDVPDKDLDSICYMTIVKGRSWGVGATLRALQTPLGYDELSMTGVSNEHR